jgi:hypothetical protein
VYCVQSCASVLDGYRTRLQLLRQQLAHTVRQTLADRANSYAKYYFVQIKHYLEWSLKYGTLFRVEFKYGLR